MTVSTAATKLDAARRALAIAEASAGLHTRLTGPTAVLDRVVDAPSAVHVGEHRSSVGTEHTLPVPHPLLPLFPHGGLRRGMPVQVSGSTSLLLALAAGACAEGAWCAVVSMPDIGLAAAAEAGLSLHRVVVVPRPGPDAAAVLGALIDGFDVVVLGTCPALSDSDRRSLTSRLRTREAVLLTSAPWPGSQLVLDVGEQSWRGVGRGHGVLRGGDLTVTAFGRGAAATRPVTVRVRVGVDGVERARSDAHAVPHRSTGPVPPPRPAAAATLFDAQAAHDDDPLGGDASVPAATTRTLARAG